VFDIAIIGAGINGSALAYFLSKAVRELLFLMVEV